MEKSRVSEHRAVRGEGEVKEKIIKKKIEFAELKKEAEQLLIDFE